MISAGDEISITFGLCYWDLTRRANVFKNQAESGSYVRLYILT